MNKLNNAELMDLIQHLSNSPPYPTLLAGRGTLDKKTSKEKGSKQSVGQVVQGARPEPGISLSTPFSLNKHTLVLMSQVLIPSLKGNEVCFSYCNSILTN